MLSNFSPFTSLPHLSQIHSNSTKHFRVYTVLVFTSAERHIKYMEHTMLPFTLKTLDSFTNVSTSVLFSPLCNESISVVSIFVSATTTQRFFRCCCFSSSFFGFFSALLLLHFQFCVLLLGARQNRVEEKKNLKMKSSRSVVPEFRVIFHFFYYLFVLVPLMWSTTPRALNAFVYEM